jgi:hypothetical protein
MTPIQITEIINILFRYTSNETLAEIERIPDLYAYTGANFDELENYSNQAEIALMGLLERKPVEQAAPELFNKLLLIFLDKLLETKKASWSTLRNLQRIFTFREQNVLNNFLIESQLVAVVKELAIHLKNFKESEGISKYDLNLTAEGLEKWVKSLSKTRHKKSGKKSVSNKKQTSLTKTERSKKQ